ncbi:MAG: PhnD/SsuA/transferrin family substrate-binding protein [Proteobacteria bacterium]|nr:PhnD/SsuA/transferrin family substrate-binding protein [Pseudomonadota bacterium]
MYNLPEMRAVNAAFWAALRGLLAEAGVAGLAEPLLPADLTTDQPPVPERIGDDVLFSQTCGYPLETLYKGQAIKLGAPCYDVPGCGGPTHCGVFIVPADSAARTLADLRGKNFVFNSVRSNSGMNLPRRALADLAGGQKFFASCTATGSHPGNLDRIARGEADATAVDNVTYAFWARYRPETAARTRILAQTPPSPAIPFVTSVATPPATVAILRDALRRLAREPRFATVRGDLLIKDIVEVPEARYQALLDYERESAALGYPQLA